MTFIQRFYSTILTHFGTYTIVLLILACYFKDVSLCCDIFVLLYADKIGKQYITSGAHNHIVAMLSNDGETDNVITLALQALSSLITSGAYVYVSN